MGVPWHCTSALRLFVFLFVFLSFSPIFSPLLRLSFSLLFDSSIASGCFSYVCVCVWYIFGWVRCSQPSSYLFPFAATQRSHMHIVSLTQYQMHTCAFSVPYSTRKDENETKAQTKREKKIRIHAMYTQLKFEISSQHQHQLQQWSNRNCVCVHVIFQN